MATDTQISKFMSLVLRHTPQKVGLTLDENGWTDFDHLCAAIRKRFGVDEKVVRRVIEESPKKRFTLEGKRIRAAQGHSVDVDLGLEPASPPETLWHGTKVQFLPAILSEGLTRQARHHVHLSKDLATAAKVAERRRGEDIILRINARAMAESGHAFYVSDNGVWLTDCVPPQFLTPVEEEVEQ